MIQVHAMSCAIEIGYDADYSLPLGCFKCQACGYSKRVQSARYMKITRGKHKGQQVAVCQSAECVAIGQLWKARMTKDKQ